jgi:ribose transport system substrate-binding protein
VTAALAAATVAGCGGSDDSSTTGGGSAGAEVDALVDKAMAPSKWRGPKEPAPAVSGKRVVIISCAQAAEGCKRVAQGYSEAAESLGWEAEVVDGKGTPDGMAAGLEQALTTKADGVLMAFIPPALVTEDLKRVRDAGIPVIDVGAETEASQVDYDVSESTVAQGKSLAAYVTKESGGKAKIAILDDPEFPTITSRLRGFREELERLCEDCEIVETQKFAITEIGTNLGGKVVSMLQSNPEIDWVVAAYDAAATPMVTAITNGGLADRVKLVSFDGNSQNFDFIRNGNVQVASAANSMEWMGWAGVDQLNRIFGKKQKVDQLAPIRLITKDNLPPEGENYTGDVDFRAEYEKLWSGGE